MKIEDKAGVIRGARDPAWVHSRVASLEKGSVASLFVGERRGCVVKWRTVIGDRGQSKGTSREGPKGSHETVDLEVQETGPVNICILCVSCA